MSNSTGYDCVYLVSDKTSAPNHHMRCKPALKKGLILSLLLHFVLLLLLLYAAKEPVRTALGDASSQDNAILTVGLYSDYQHNSTQQKQNELIEESPQIQEHPNEPAQPKEPIPTVTEAKAESSEQSIPESPIEKETPLIAETMTPPKIVPKITTEKTLKRNVEKKAVTTPPKKTTTRQTTDQQGAPIAKGNKPTDKPTMAPVSGSFAAAQPRATHQPLPRFPDRAFALQQEGHVRVRFDIDGQGRVTNLHIMESNPKRVFDKEVRLVLKRWQYSSQNHKNVEVTFQFKLDRRIILQ